MQKRIPLSRYCIIPIISIALMIGLNNILLVVDIAKYSEAYRQAAEALYAPSLAVRILYSGMLIPIIEEVLFRKLVFGFMRKRCSYLWSMLVSSILFGAYHGNLVQFIYASVCGMLLAYLYEIYGRIGAPILAHMTMNVVANIMTEFGIFTWILENVFRVLIVTVLCALILYFAMISLQKMVRNPEIDILRKC